MRNYKISFPERDGEQNQIMVRARGQKWEKVYEKSSIQLITTPFKNKF